MTSNFELQALNYPYDAGSIARKARSLKKILIENPVKQEVRIAILGGSTTAHIKTFLDLFLLKKGIKATFWESEFNQYYADGALGNKSLAEFNPKIVLVYNSLINISQYPLNGDGEVEIRNLINAEVERFKNIWSGIKKQTNAVIIQNNFEYPQHRVLGNLDGIFFTGKVNFIRKLNNNLSDAILSEQGVYLHDQNYLSALVGLDQWHDSSWWFLYKYASSLHSFPYIAESLSAIVQSVLGLSKKNLILDLDNTLWGGVIGDDGVNGIQLGPDTASGESFIAFQGYCRELKERGVILSICSKNELVNAQEGFLKRDSVLKLKDFASFKANWNRKDQNIQNIAEELSLGLDSFVFIDDNPTEREIVQRGLPDVAVPNVGSDVDKFATIIDRNYFFEPVSFSDDDKKRSAMYEQNAQRRVLETNFTDYGDYLQSLEMVAEIGNFKAEYIERITQLINKTNQFNLTTKRMTLEEVTSRTQDPNSIVLYGRLKDKFGDNGLVSVMMGELINNEIILDLWLMSCRVLKKDFEKAMLDEFIKIAQKKADFLKGLYIPSEKNKMVEQHYKDLGFSQLDIKENKTFWILDIRNYAPQNKYIKVLP
jgi:FkbH-like protein